MGTGWSTLNIESAGFCLKGGKLSCSTLSDTIVPTGICTPLIVSHLPINSNSISIITNSSPLATPQRHKCGEPELPQVNQPGLKNPLL